ncbi:MAG: glycosyl hydrolase [Oscillospiraceae bacterium]
MCNSSAKKICASVMAFATAITALSAMPETDATISADSVKYEFEDGKIEGTSTTVQTEEIGYSGTGYVYLKDAGDIISVEVDVPETGMYEIAISYYLPASIGDSKIQNILINDVNQGQAGFTSNDTFTETVIGTYKLNKGTNTVALQSSWGWTMFDYVTVKSAELPELIGNKTLTDAKATDSAKRLMSYLGDVYGKHIISGQQEIYQYGPHDFEYEFNYIKENTGELPAIRGFDYGNFTCPAFGSDDGSTDRIIDWVNNKGGIATSSWHLNVPTVMENYNIGDKIDWSQTTYSEKTDFSPSKAATPGTKENEYYMQALTTLAAEFKKLEAENIPVIWRPLHEAEGGGGETGSWFWWGREGSKAYKDLWIYTYKTLTEDFDCHNLIWEWNSYTYATSTDWYPGDEYVDIIGYDKYNCTDWSSGSPVLNHNDSAISGTFYSLVKQYDGKKMIAMSENDSIPTLANILDEKAGWLYFCPWYDGGSDSTNFLSNPVFNKVEDLKEMYQSEYCITLDELPDLKTYPLDGSGEEPIVTEPVVTTETTETTEAVDTSEITETTTAVSIDDVVTLKGTVLDIDEDTITVDFETFDSSSIVIAIPENQKGTLDNIEAGDKIIIGYSGSHGSATEPLWIDLLEKAETTESTSTETETDDTSASETKPSEATMLGDANGDGEIDVRDVTIMCQHIVKMTTLEGTQFANADIETDGEVDVKDLSQLKKFLINAITSL